MIGSVVASQLGARNHYAIPRALAAAGRLERLYTDICGSVGWPRVLRTLPSALQPPAVRRLVGRKPVEVPPERIVTFPAMALELAISRWAARDPSERTAADLWGGRRFSGLVVREGFGEAAGIIGYNSACLEQFQAARARGLWTAVDQTIVPSEMVAKLLAEESEAFPGWAPPLVADRYADEYAARERAEWDNADVVLCASEFVRLGVADSGGPLRRCVVVPYGVDARFSMPVRTPHPGPLRILTIGEVGLRKGSPYVLKAAQRLKGRAVFRMVGPWGVSTGVREAMQADVELTGPMPRSEILAHFAWADVFLLPSICEGSAVAIYEALAAGLPVVCTPNTGSVVRDGVDGFVVPARNEEAITERLEILSADAERRRQMGIAAGEQAASFTLKDYARRLLAALPTNEAAPARKQATPKLIREGA
jgi:hypothetical protein